MKDVRRSRSDEAVLITSAPSSRDEEYERRRRRYAIMMGGRALCVLLAALTYHVSILLALALVVGGAVLPWCAVLIANDGPARKRRPATAEVPVQPDLALPGADDDRTIDG